MWYITVPLKQLQCIPVFKRNTAAGMASPCPSFLTRSNVELVNVSAAPLAITLLTSAQD